MLTQYVLMWRKFVFVEIRISKIREMRSYLTFGFLGFKVVNKRTMNLFYEGAQRSEFHRNSMSWLFGLGISMSLFFSLRILMSWSFFPSEWWKKMITVKPLTLQLLKNNYPLHYSRIILLKHENIRLLID